ncbi:MAG: pirin family protein [Thalassospira sp.]|uniref:pirin family protein n=1 Tax=Thalassospira sp. TaxID=1912094 RepID=UPI001B2DCA6E|nr:pirin family protein [Thalassospira sp.]MBO6580608.1 pirin family protein [Thalassospira sp.]MBO6817645.1 pirin family protein [Thalassospira sp.]MBO6887297.1 pirin family protein [Thalassospira sp.]
MVKLIFGKESDLGGISVRRVLPHRDVRSVGPFVFFDHMGPVEFQPGQGIDVPPHPHTCLATVTYLFKGAILHRDSLGSDLEITPGDLNWMSAGRGITHSERETDAVRNSVHELDGLQLWVALPDEAEESDPAFYHVPKNDLPVIEDAGLHMRLIAGEAFGKTAPVPVKSKLYYLDVEMDEGAQLLLPGENQEGAVYVVSGTLLIDGESYKPESFIYVAPEEIPDIVAKTDCRVMLLGGLPVGRRYIWWNFVASSKERIEAAKADWAAGKFPQIDGEDDALPLPERSTG